MSINEGVSFSYYLYQSNNGLVYSMTLLSNEQTCHGAGGECRIMSVSSVTPDFNDMGIILRRWWMRVLLLVSDAKIFFSYELHVLRTSTSRIIAREHRSDGHGLKLNEKSMDRENQNTTHN
jgi:hypothetical protein